jgi:hypothetical protein
MAVNELRPTADIVRAPPQALPLLSLPASGQLQHGSGDDDEGIGEDKIFILETALHSDNAGQASTRKRPARAQPPFFTI